MVHAMVPNEFYIVHSFKSWSWYKIADCRHPESTHVPTCEASRIISRHIGKRAKVQSTPHTSQQWLAAQVLCIHTSC